MSVSAMFVALQGALTADQDIREEIRKVVQALEQTAREMLTLLQGVHQGAGFQDSESAINKCNFSWLVLLMFSITDQHSAFFLS
uniref:Uncharacterized protein n=1 Tax=Pavo cristatus TaxID=9049 RepID=A0A8C9EVT9_PAVCR